MCGSLAERKQVFCPITLSNAVLQIFERFMYKRINPYFDELLPSWRFGFWSKRGASDQLLRLVSVLRDKNASGVHKGILFLDIEKTFDRIDTRSFICGLHSHRLRGRTLFSIQNNFSDLCVRVLFKDNVAECYSPEEGTTPGGILSPLFSSLCFWKVAEAAEKSSCKPLFFGFSVDVAIVVHWTSQSLYQFISVSEYGHRSAESNFRTIRFNVCTLIQLDIKKM